MPQGLDAIETKWDALGRQDPLWAILTDPSKIDGQWSTDDFFATGRGEIDEVFADLDRRGIPVRTGLALDFGCGVGRLTQALARRFDRVVGLDVAPSMIELATAYDRSDGKVSYRVNRTERLVGVDDRSVDFIYSNIVLQHIPPELSSGYIAEFARVLSPAGVAVFQIPSRPRTTAGRLKSLLKRRLPAVFALLKTTVRGRRVPTMDMYGIPPARVESILRSGGCTVAAALPDQAAGPDWTSFRYVVVKDSTGAR